MVKKKGQLLYPAVFHLAKEGGYSVEIPDLKGCVSEGDTLAEAIDMITESACGWVLDELEEGEKAPVSFTYEDISNSYKGEIVSLIVLHMVLYAEKYDNIQRRILHL